MNRLDDRLSSAASELRAELDQVDLAPFKPKRSATPVMLVIVLLLGIGIVGYVARSRPSDSGGVSVATQPEVPEDVAPDSLGGEEDTPVSAIDENAPVPEPQLSNEPNLGPDGEPAGEATALGRSFAVTIAAPGEFFVPLPMAEAWNPDHIRLLVYKTGAANPGHQVIDTLVRDNAPIDLPITPADIEQVYWNPLNTDQVLYATGADLMVFDLNTMTSTVEHRFEGCDQVDSGILPVPPAQDATLSLLCRSGATLTQVVYDLATGAETRAATQSDTAALPSPSGNYLVRWNEDNSASVLDRELNETGTRLDIEGNRFGFVTDVHGREWIATTLFDGPAVGSIVLLPLDGLDDPVVVIGPERGDAYPPSGTSISASGSKVVIAIQGDDDNVLAGRITLVDVSVSLTDPPRQSMPHRSQDLHGYWSTPFVALDSLGLFAYSSDGGRDSVDTYVGNFIADADEPGG